MFKRFHWKPLAILAAVLGVGIVAARLLFCKMGERTTFVSKTVVGYRYRCTFSPDWHPTHVFSIPLHESTEDYSFAPTPSPIREWIAVHLFRHLPSTGNMTGAGPTLDLETYSVMTRPNPIKIQAGYPEPDFSSIDGGRALTEKHFRIDGCPATEGRYEVMFAGITYRGTALFVCTPGSKTEYVVSDIEDRQYSNQADREMQSVVSSFHIEKVASTDSER